jgi:DNA-directed RNA polymerase specialized sigma24 family protein
MMRGTLQRQSDERLAALVASGSRPAADALDARYRAPLSSYCARVLGSARADLAAERTMTAACGALRAGLQPLRLRPWLFAIAVDICRTELRHGASVSPPAPAPSASRF